MLELIEYRSIGRLSVLLLLGWIAAGVKLFASFLSGNSGDGALVREGMYTSYRDSIVSKRDGSILREWPICDSEEIESMRYAWNMIIPF